MARSAKYQNIPMKSWFYTTTLLMMKILQYVKCVSLRHQLKQIP